MSYLSKMSDINLKSLVKGRHVGTPWMGANMAAMR